MAALWSIAFRVFLALTASEYGLLAIYPIVAMAARLARLPTVDRYTAVRHIIETA
jgi:aconitase B